MDEQRFEILSDTITGDPVAVIVGECTYAINTILSCPTVVPKDALMKIIRQLELSKFDLVRMIDALYEQYVEEKLK